VWWTGDIVPGRKQDKKRGGEAIIEERQEERQ
jgi:hypothetical protein